MRERLKSKTLVFGAVVILLLTGLSPVYAGFAFTESTSIKKKTVETTNVENRNLLDGESFLDRYKSSELEEHYHKHPYFNRHDQHNPIRKPTIVDGEGWDIVVPDDYSTIQEAINNADRGCRILVRIGIYEENVEIDVRSLILHGENRESTIINGGRKGNVITVISEANGINISGFSIRNSGENYAGLNISSNYNIVEDTIIQNNDNGINLYYSSGNQILNNEIENNNCDGAWMHCSNGNEMEGNTIQNNGHNGVEFTYYSLGTTIEDNIVSDNANCGVLINESSLGNTVTGNNIENNYFGVKCIGISDGNTFHHNIFVGNNQNAYDSSMDLWDDSSMGNYWDDYDGVDADGDGIGDTSYDIPGGDNQDRFPVMNPAMTTQRPLEQEAIAEANSCSKDEKPTIEDCSNNNQWDIIVPDDYPTIQEAVDNSDNGYNILVRTGIYNEVVVIDKPSITLHGEDKNTTVIDCDENTEHVITITAPYINISGFTICNSSSGYHGIFTREDNITLEDNIIEDCTCGIILFGYDNNKVINNVLNSNELSGIMVWNSVGNLIINNYIIRNGDGVVLISESSADLSRNKVENNSFNGLLLISCSNALIKENRIEYNGFDIESKEPSNTVWFGIQMFSSDNNKIEGNFINYCPSDLSLSQCSNNTVRNNIVQNFFLYGISFWYFSERNIIEKNEIRSIHLFGFLDGFGIWLKSSSNNTINSNNLFFNLIGINLEQSSDNIISDNKVKNARLTGICLSSSSDNVISCNSVTDMKSSLFGFGLCMGIYLFSYSDRNVISSNNVSNIKGLIAISGICIISSSYNVIFENTIINLLGSQVVGISLGDSSHNSNVSMNIITDARAISRAIGIGLGNSTKNNIFRNEVANILGLLRDGSGISLSGSSNNHIYGNIIKKANGFGIYLYDSLNNDVSENNVTDTSLILFGFGISLLNSCGNNISGNTVTDIRGLMAWGISLMSSSNNTIYHNNFIDNTFNAMDDSSNYWDNGYPSGGNYWDDYTGIDADADGIGDTPYEIPVSNNQDRYPLIRPYVKSKVKIKTSNLASNDILEIILDRFPLLERFLQLPLFEIYFKGGE